MFINLNIYEAFECNRDGLYKQLSFNEEVDSIKRLGVNNKLNKAIIVPKTYNIENVDPSKYILMEFINGDKVQNVENKKKIEEYKVFMNYGIKCLMFDGYSHGDLHSGNILFVKDTETDCSNNELKLAILDCGIMNENTVSERDIFHDYFDALRKNDATLLTTISLTKLADPENRY